MEKVFLVMGKVLLFFIILVLGNIALAIIDDVAGTSLKEIDNFPKQAHRISWMAWGIIFYLVIKQLFY